MEQNLDPEDYKPAALTIPRSSAREKLLQRIDIGRALVEADNHLYSVDADVRQNFVLQYDRWNNFNEHLIRRIFSNNDYASEYFSAGNVTIRTRDSSPEERRRASDERIRLGLRRKLSCLQSIAERLDLIDEEDQVGRTSGGSVVGEASVGVGSVGVAVRVPNRKIFIVHGKDEEIKAIVARFLEKCGLEPIILHEQLDQGLTIIEKFELNSDVSFAVVILSPDDVGALASEYNPSNPELRHRARQNVILELGYFVGELTRSKVFALKRGDLELPSDYLGVVFTTFSADEGWKLKSAREIKAAGIDIDLNGVFGR